MWLAPLPPEEPTCSPTAFYCHFALTTLRILATMYILKITRWLAWKHWADFEREDTAIALGILYFVMLYFFVI